MIISLTDAYYQYNIAIYTKDYRILIFYLRTARSSDQFLHLIDFPSDLLFQAPILICLWVATDLDFFIDQTAK